MKIKHLPIIINPASGKPQPILSIVNDVFKGSTIKWDVLILKKSGDALSFVKELIERKEQVIAVYGGDGTVMEVMSALLGTAIPLVIIPGGTANVMAVELGIPQDVKGVFEMIRDENYVLQPVDLGKFNRQYFMLRTCVGFEADMVKGANRETKNKFGRLAYLFSAINAMKKIKLTNYEVNVDGETQNVKGLTCIIANSGSAGFGGIYRLPSKSMSAMGCSMC